MSFGSEALFSAFDTEGWNSGKAPKVEEAYKTLPTRTDSDRVKELEIENDRLRRVVGLITPSKPIKDQDDGPLCQINFFHNQQSLHYKDGVIKLLTEFLIDAEKNRKMDKRELPRHTAAIVLPNRDEDYDEFTIIQSIHVFPDGHILDRIGEPLDRNCNPEQSNWIIPSYECLYKDMMTEDVEDDLERVEKQKKKIFNCCFNCGSDQHGIKDCKDPRNPEEINKRKNEFQKAVGGTPRRSTARVFEVGAGYSGDKRFTKFQPGHVSDSLREAMGIKEDQLPPWVVDMRRYGYPPGWLCDAEVRENTVRVQEEGELNEINPIFSEETRTKVVAIDVARIVEYPGYNVPLLEGVKDDGRPPYNKKDSKELFVEKYCTQRNCRKIERKRKASSDSNYSNPPKMTKLEDDSEGDEFDEVDELFQAGWVKLEETEDPEISSKGLPSRNKWQTGVVAFAHDAYQVEATKTGAYKKLKKTLKKEKEPKIEPKEEPQEAPMVTEE